MTRIARTTTALALASAIAAPSAPAQEGGAFLPRAWWALGAGAVAVTAAGDARADRFVARHRDRLLDHMANAGDELGAARSLLPAMAGAWLLTTITGQRTARNDVLSGAAAYAAGNLVVDVFKPLIGRHRPIGARSPWEFRPFASRGEDHSWPSGHVMHTVSLATAVALSTSNPWLRGAAIGATGLVAWSRVYDRQHWSSDAVSSIVIGVPVAAMSWRWAARRLGTREPGTRHSALGTRRSPPNPGAETPECRDAVSRRVP